MGYLKDRYTADELESKAPVVYAEFKASEPSSFLKLPATEVLPVDGKLLEEAKQAEVPTTAQAAVIAADQVGDRKTLKSDALIPGIMAIIFLGLLIYFKSIGGYKALTIGKDGVAVAAAKHGGEA